jgi:hypothetical protein
VSSAYEQAFDMDVMPTVDNTVVLGDPSRRWKQLCAVSAEVGSLILVAGSKLLTLSAGSQAGDTPYTLPTAYPASSGYVLASTTSGVMSWVAQSGGGGTPGGSDTYIQFNDGGSAFGGDSMMTFNKTTKVVTLNHLQISYSGGVVTLTQV